MDAALVVAQVLVHGFAFEDADRAGWLAEAHGVNGNQAVQAGEAIHDREPDRARVEAAHVVIGMV